MKINAKQLEREELLWSVEKDLIKRKEKLENEKKLFKRKGAKITTTKLLILFLFINCTAIEIFTGWSIVQSLKLTTITGLAPDFTPLVTLIGAVVGEVFGFAVYAAKSSCENRKGGVVYETAMKNLQNNDNVAG